MNILLIFFALPIAVIIISAILEKLLRSPVMVASLVFAVFLVITFTFCDETFLIATLAFTILAFLVALIVHFLRDKKEEHNICDLLRELLENNNNICNNNGHNDCDEDDAVESVGNTIEDLLANSANNNENNNNCNCVCNRNRKR